MESGLSPTGRPNEPGAETDEQTDGCWLTGVKGPCRAVEETQGPPRGWAKKGVGTTWVWWHPNKKEMRGRDANQIEFMEKLKETSSGTARHHRLGNFFTQEMLAAKPQRSSH